MPHLHVTWLVHTWRESLTWDVTYLLRRDSFRQGICVCPNTKCVCVSHVVHLILLRHDSFACNLTRFVVICLIDMWCDSFAYDSTYSHVTWLIYSDVIRFVAIHVYVPTQSVCVCHMSCDSFNFDTTYAHTNWLIYMLSVSFRYIFMF